MSKKAIIILAIVVLFLIAIASGIFFYVGSANKANVAKNISSAVPALKSGGITKVDLSKPPIPSVQSSQPIPKRELTSSDSVPTVFFAITKDVSKGYNLKIATTNFAFVSENTTEDLGPNKGYSKLYINNTFVTRIYGSDYYIQSLKPGKYNVKIELSDTASKSIAKDGKIVEYILDFEVK